MAIDCIVVEFFLFYKAMEKVKEKLHIYKMAFNGYKSDCRLNITRARVDEKTLAMCGGIQVSPLQVGRELRRIIRSIWPYGRLRRSVVGCLLICIDIAIYWILMMPRVDAR